VILKVLKGKNTPQSLLRNGIKSRQLKGFEGHNIKIEQIFKLASIGSDENLLLMAQAMPTVVLQKSSRKL
jgi:hydrogenase maturation factor HypF (carbamoyltransferase family)